MEKLSPMMKQYLEIKAHHKDHVLFYRLGDFYEMFFEDAVNISKELELTLTARDCGLPQKAPMCGIPYHSSEPYIKRLIDKGYKVAICEQMENPADVKGIVRREVVRVVTPGTVIENSLLSEDVNNFIASIVTDKKRFAICFADISTGEVHLTEQGNGNISIEIISELSKFTPSEILFNDKVLDLKVLCEFIKHKLMCAVEIFDKEDINENSCKILIDSHFKDQTVDSALKIAALGGLINYVNKTQKDGAQRLTKINFYNEDEHMSIDIAAKRNLEITKTIRSGEKRGTLLWVLDKTKTAMGKRFMRNALEQPLISLAAITRRQSAVAELVADKITCEEVGECLSKVYDLERLMTRVVYGTVNPRELKALSFTISHLPAIKVLTSKTACQLLKQLDSSIYELNEVHALIENAIADEPPIALKDGGIIRAGFNEQLDEYRDLCSNAKQFITNIEENQRRETGIKNLKIGYNRVFGYYIEVTKSNVDMVPETYIRKQTLSNCERYITEELKQLEAKVLNANDKILAIESDIFNEVRKFVSANIDEIQQTATAIAQLDFLYSLATVASVNGYICPTMTIDGVISIKNGRHPSVELLLEDSLFVPNDTTLDQKHNKMAIITGPNMAGKSTYMRQVAIITIMAHIGSFVPATSASISICDKIFTRVGASDDLSTGQSTFMVEMSEVAHILKNATPNSLVILDEIGRGTSTFDGMSIAKAVVAHMVTSKKLSCKTLFATHYHELTALEGEYDGVQNYNIAAKKRGDDIIFLRKIVSGGADDSYGIEVAKLAGVPQVVVDHAKEILLQLETKIDKPVSQPQKEQMTLVNNGALTDKLNALQIDTITPIEALNVLYELKKMVIS